MPEEKRLIKWIKDHQRELIIAGISIGSIALILVILSNKGKHTLGALKMVSNQTSSKTPKNLSQIIIAQAPSAPVPETVPTAISAPASMPCEVSAHIRNLPNGRHASPEKKAEAAKKLIVLLDNQTWVKSYRKGIVAA